MKSIIETAKTIKFTKNITSSDISAEHDLDLAKLEILEFVIGRDNIKMRMRVVEQIIDSECLFDALKATARLGFELETIIRIIGSIYQIEYYVEDRNLQLASALAYANWVGDITIEQLENLKQGETYD